MRKKNDTAYVKGMQVMFVFAEDTVKNNFIDIVRSKNGMLLIKNNPMGIGRYLDDNNIQSIYFKKDNNEEKIELYYKIGLGISNSLQTMLNIAASNERPFSRSELDSFFRYFIFGRNANVDFIKLYDTLPPRTELIDESYKRVTRNISKKCNANNLRYLSDFYNYLKQNKGKNNFFFYRGISGTSGTGYFLITVNEQFKSDSLSQKFYEKYSPVGHMYSVKGYFPYYIIEEGEY
jgi:hypothetical protein